MIFIIFIAPRLAVNSPRTAVQRNYYWLVWPELLSRELSKPGLQAQCPISIAVALLQWQLRYSPTRTQRYKPSKRHRRRKNCTFLRLRRVIVACAVTTWINRGRNEGHATDRVEDAILKVKMKVRASRAVTAFRRSVIATINQGSQRKANWQTDGTNSV